MQLQRLLPRQLKITFGNSLLLPLAISAVVFAPLSYAQQSAESEQIPQQTPQQIPQQTPQQIPQQSEAPSEAQASQDKQALLTMPIAALGKKQPVKISALDGMQLSADYFRGAPNQGGVLLLHGCHSHKNDYQGLGKILAQQGLHALTLDFRGFGQSANEKFSHKKLKSQSSDMVSYQANIGTLTAFWDGDINAAYQFLEQKISAQRGISVVATGCSVVQAINLAEEKRLDSLVFIVPNIGHIAREQYKNLIDYPTYFIAPAYQSASFGTAKELFEWNGHDQSKWQIFKGNALGHTLLRKSPELEQDIAQWINRVQ